MLWSVKKPKNSGLYWLDIVYKNFYTKLFENADFEDCFCEEFNDVLAESEKTNDMFTAVYAEYHRLDGLLQQEVRSIFANHMDYKQCFSSTDIIIKKPSAGLFNFWKNVKSLATYLYSTTIGLVCFRNACREEADIDVHYQEYRDLNGIVCCFCGTEEMMEEREIEPEDGACSTEEKQWRASYDHYLPKKLYPFLSVDFDNLIPCCQKCNEKAKGEVDVLTANGVRTLAFYPYEDERTVKLEASLVRIDEKLDMSVNIINIDDELHLKAISWNRVFKVIPRVNKRLKNFNRSWLAPLFNGVTRVDDIREVLRKEIARCDKVMKDEREAFFKSLCFSEVARKTDEEIQALMHTVQEVYSGRSLG